MRPNTQCNVILVFLTLFVGGVLMPCASAQPTPVQPPATFTAPGYEKQVEELESLFTLHYPGAGPKATMWDEWLSLSSLWPAADKLEEMRTSWSQVLSTRIFEGDGYVSTHQHGSIAHQHGWPFPFYHNAGGTWGWHFALPPIDKNWHESQVSDEKGWVTNGIESKGVVEGVWSLVLQNNNASITTPGMDVDFYCAPFLQLRWKAKGLGNAQPYVEWVNSETEEFSPTKRLYFAPVESDALIYTMIPVFEHPEWKDRIKKLRISFNTGKPGATVSIDSFFTQFDTRHSINNSSFILGADYYFRWTGDVNFLRNNIERMRTSLLYVLSVLHLAERHVVLTDFVGHDGRAGYTVKPDGGKEFHFGHGIGSDYWDILPIGHLDAYATNQCYSALLRFAALEESIVLHPEWNIPISGQKMDPAYLRELAGAVRTEYQKTFWNEQTGRFVACIDADGNGHDYGFTFINLEAIYYGLPSTQQAQTIMDWIDGKRTVEGDTSTGADIYHWRFAPRATTKRNLEWYFWGWSGPETISFGDQIQDGGAVLGFSYFDIMSRLVVRGPDDAWDRLMTIADWFGEVQGEGGYRKYYEKPGRGSMQGGGTPGGLGLDAEFFESVMVPQTILYGFLGFEPATDGFFINPSLPTKLPSLSVKGIAWRDLVLDVEAKPNSIVVRYHGKALEPISISLPEGKWAAIQKNPSGEVVPGGTTNEKGNVWVLNLADEGLLEFTR